MSEELIFYDLPRRGRCGCWSLNTWRTRLVLNYKEIPYNTEWVDFPDVEAKFKPLGIPPNPAGDWADYTIPAIRFPDGSYVMNSSEIVKRLEEKQHEPSLRLDTDLQDEAQQILFGLLGPLCPWFMPQIRRNLATEYSEEWVKKDREKRFGQPEAEWEAQKGGDAAWTAAEPGFQRLSEFLKKHKKDDGPFVQGSAPSYVDFMVAGVCNMFTHLGDGAYERFVGKDEALRKLYKACAPWLEKDQ